MNLTPDEEKVLLNVDFIQTKRVVAEKICNDLSLFSDKISELVNSLHKDHSIHQYLINYPKISKGENYGGLPYFILDYPRVFKKENTFAIRTMVYWGNFYSFTLQLSGEAQKVLSKKILAEKDTFSNYFFCINESPWEYHYKEDNYQLISSLSEEKLHKALFEKPFLKVSIPYKLAEYQNLHKCGLLFYEKIFSLLS